MAGDRPATVSYYSGLDLSEKELCFATMALVKGLVHKRSQAYLMQVADSMRYIAW
jgi:hypothetical protein